MRLSAKATFGLSILGVLAFAPPAPAQTNGIASPIQKVSPTGAVTIPQAEVPSVGTLDPVQPHWVFVNRGNGQDGTRIFDGDTGKMQGMVNMYGQDSFAFDPLGKNFYVAQTIWSKLDRGQRQDMLLVYDVRQPEAGGGSSHSRPHADRQPHPQSGHHQRRQEGADLQHAAVFLGQCGGPGQEEASSRRSSCRAAPPC